MKKILLAAIGACGLAACASGPAGPDVEGAARLMDDGREAAKRNDHTAAVEAFSAAIGANPELAEAWYERGVSRVALRLSRTSEGDGRVYEEKAVEDFSRAVRLNPAFADAYYNRAMVLASRAQFKPAVEDLLTVVRYRPREPEPHLWLGRLYESKFEDRAALAMDHYEKYVDAGGIDPEVREKVRLWKEIKKAAAAPAAPSGLAPAAPGDEAKARALHDEFKTLFADGKKDEARKAVETLLGQYGQTAYVRGQKVQLTALLNALKR